MVMTKTQSAANAREVRAAKHEAALTPRRVKGEPTTYTYVGGMNAVLVIVDGTTYEFRLNDPVHLPHAVANLDANPDFEKVAE
jgi:hypothetical protein